MMKASFSPRQWIADDLAYGHPHRLLAKNLSLRIAAGDCWCLLGRNGAGKTTLLRTLCGVLPALAGRVLIDDTLLTTLPSIKRAQSLALVLQLRNPVDSRSVAEWTMLGRAAMIPWSATPSTTDEAAVREALHAVGMQGFAHRVLAELSGGEQQLVHLARALAQQAQFLALDEPLANLDPANDNLILNLLATLRATGRGVLFSSHNPNHALRLAAKVILLRAGEVVAMGDAQQVLSEDNLRRVYGLNMQRVSVPHGQFATQVEVLIRW